LPSWPANWRATLVSTTGRHHWPEPLATCSKHVDDEDDIDNDYDDDDSDHDDYGDDGVMVMVMVMMR
jgi:hypothetical protein